MLFPVSVSVAMTFTFAPNDLTLGNLYNLWHVFNKFNKLQNYRHSLSKKRAKIKMCKSIKSNANTNNNNKPNWPWNYYKIHIYFLFMTKLIAQLKCKNTATNQCNNKGVNLTQQSTSSNQKLDWNFHNQQNSKRLETIK